MIKRHSVFAKDCGQWLKFACYYHNSKQHNEELKLVVGFNTAKLSIFLCIYNYIEQSTALNFSTSTFEKAISVYAVKYNGNHQLLRQ